MNLSQTLRLLLDDLKDLFAEHLNQFGGEMRPDAFDESGAQVPLHPFRAARMGCANRVSFELLSMVSVYDPTTFGFDIFARYREREVSHQRDEIMVILDSDLEDSEAVVWVVKCYSFDAAKQRF